MKLYIKLSLCRRENYDIANCKGFDLFVHRGYFYLNAHCHSGEKSLFIFGLNFSVSVILPNYFKVHLSNNDTHCTRQKSLPLSPMQPEWLMERYF